jgi:predicted acetyltransferase
MPLEPPGLTLRTFSADEVVTFMRFVESAFLDDYHDEDADIDQALFEPERTLGYFDGAAPVATAIINTRRMTVPGGPLPVAAVTGVAVAPTHRRQGLLSALMRRQLTDLHDQQREAVAILWASEAAIYGRYGYGAACLVNHLDIASAETRVRPTVERSGRLQVCSLDDAQPALTAVYEQVRPSRAGYLDRPGAWWTARTYDPPRRRDGASAVRFAIHHDDAGSPDGYAIYSVKGTWSPAGPQGELSIRELQATTPAAYAAVWSFLLETDLVRRVRWDRAAVDEPLRYLVDNPRAVQQRFVDSLWVRLVDVDRALAGRTYATPLDVVLDVSDEVCPWNAGRYRLSADPSAGSAECRRTTDEPDLSLPVAALGAAYLGGTGLATLAAAGLVTERRPGALAAATTAFLAQRPPSCPEVF